MSMPWGQKSAPSPRAHGSDVWVNSAGDLIASSAASLLANQHLVRLPWLRFGASPLTVKPIRFRAFGLCSYVPCKARLRAGCDRALGWLVPVPCHEAATWCCGDTKRSLS
jgi:hypothetical protein